MQSFVWSPLQLAFQHSTISSLEGGGRGAICAGSLVVDHCVVGTTVENGFSHAHPTHPSDRRVDEMIFD